MYLSRAFHSRRFFSAIVGAALLLLAAPYGIAKDPGAISEDAAIALLKHTNAASLDPALPRRPFSAWVAEKFSEWSIRWELNDCGEATGIPATDKNRDMPACVELDIMQPSQLANTKASRGYHVLFQVGTQKKGLLAIPQFRSATRQMEDESENVALADVEP